MGAEDSGADFDSTCLSENIASGGWLLRLSGQLLPVGGADCRRKDHIRARYMEVEIDRDGTARLTLVPGKMETVKLTD